MITALNNAAALNVGRSAIINIQIPMDLNMDSRTYPEDILREFEKARRQNTSDRLSPQQISVLRQVVQNGKVLEKALKSSVSAGPLSRTASLLCERGLITRSIDPEDARRRILVATRKGVGTLESLDKVFAGALCPGIRPQDLESSSLTTGKQDPPKPSEPGTRAAEGEGPLPLRLEEEKVQTDLTETEEFLAIRTNDPRGPTGSRNRKNQ